jgi:cobalt-zinc-cadmium efflux system outer membrane protein
MDLSHFEQLALAGNPTLPQANALVRESEGLARQAGLMPNPVVGYQGEQIRGGLYRGGEQGAFVQQTFVLGGKLGLRRNVYEQQTREDQIGVEEQRYRVLGGVRQQFYATLAAQEMLDLRKRLLGLATDAVETAHQLANVGQADAPDVLQAEVEAEQAKVDYTTAQRIYLQQFGTLAALVGRGDLPVSPLKGTLENFPAIDVDHAMDQIAQNSPSVKRAQQELARAQAELKSAKRESIPDLQIHAGLQNNFEPLNEAGTRIVGVQAFVTAGITLPLFNRNQGNVAAAAAGLERAQSEITRVQLSLRQGTQPVVQNYLSAKAAAEHYKNEMIPRATKAYQLYLAKYRQMGAAYPQVIVSQRTLFQLQVAYIGVLQQLWSSAISLQNFLLSNGLEAPETARSTNVSLNLNAAGGAQ